MNIYKHIHDNIISVGCQRSRFPNSHAHHILPKHSDGPDDPSNISYLTPLEHTIVHQLRWKIYQNVNDLRSMYMLGANLTTEDRRTIGKWCYENNIGFHAMSKERRREIGSRTGRYLVDNKIGFHGWSKEQRSEAASNAGKRSYEAGNNTEFMYWASPEGRKERSSMGGKAIDGYRIVHHPNESGYHRIPPDEVDAYLDKGYKLGTGQPGPNTGNHTPKVKKRKPVIIDGIKYDGVTMAAKDIGTYPAKIINRCKSEKWPTWHYASDNEL